MNNYIYCLSVCWTTPLAASHAFNFSPVCYYYYALSCLSKHHLTLTKKYRNQIVIWNIIRETTRTRYRHEWRLILGVCRWTNNTAPNIYMYVVSHLKHVKSINFPLMVKVCVVCVYMRRLWWVILSALRVIASQLI